MEPLITLEKPLWTIHKILKKNIQGQALTKVPLLAQSIAHYQLKHSEKISVNLWIKMKKLLDQSNISMKSWLS